MSEMALELIRKAKAEGWKRLDLGNTGIVGEVPAEIWELTELEELILSAVWHQWIEGSYDHFETKNSGLENKITSFPSHPFLHLAENKGKHAPIPHPALSQLRMLVLSGSDVANIQPLAQLITLEKLYLDSTSVVDIQPLAQLLNLQEIDIGNTLISDIKALARLSKLNTIDLCDTQITDLQPLDQLHKLQRLSLGNSKVAEFHLLARLQNLNALDLSGTPIFDLQQLDQLHNLQNLNLSGTKVADIQPLANLSNLQSLDLSGTKVADIQPLAKLGNLQSLDLSATKVADIQPLAKLSNLQYLCLGGTQVADIQPLAKLSNLQYLDLHETQVADIQPLANLSNLQELNLFATQVADIQPLAKLSNLQYLYLFDTQVADIQPISQLSSLHTLNLHFTQVTDIQPLATSIKKGIEVKLIPDGEKGIFIGDCPLTNPPYEIAIQGNQAILNFWREVEEEKAIPATELKLFLLGNTTAGKSTLAHILTKGEYPPKELHSTFGAKIDEQWTLGDKRVNIWDFGGQEYFHATHQMLLNGNAIYLVMVDPAHNQDAFLDTEVWHFGDPQPSTELLEHFHYRYWLEQIQAHDPNAHVFLLWNKVKDASQCSHLRIKDEDEALFSAKGAIEPFPCELQLAFQAKDKFWIRKWEDIHEALDRAIQKKLKEAIVLSYWPTLRDIFTERSRAQLWIPYEEFVQLCQAPGKDRDINNIIVYLRDMTGRILYFDRPELAGKVFLHPQHINTLIYAILSRQVIDQQGGFSLDHAKSQVEKALQEINSLRAYGVESKVDLTVDLLLIMQEFGLVFETEKGLGRYVAPQYLPKNQPETVESAIEFANFESGFHIRFQHYIPRHIIPRFIAAKGLLAIQRNYWKYGIIFKQDGVTALAFVDYYPTRTISVWAGKPNAPASEAHPLQAIFEKLHALFGQNVQFEVSVDKNHWVSYENIRRGLRTRAIEVETVDGALIGLDGFHQIFPGVKAVHHPMAIVNARVTLEDILQAIQRGNHGINAFTEESRAHFAKSQANDDQIISALDRQEQQLQRLLDRTHALHHQNSQFRDQFMSLLHRLDDKADQQLLGLAEQQDLLTAMDEAIVQGLPDLAADLRDEINVLKPPSNASWMDRFKVNLVKLVAVAGATAVAGPAGLALIPLLESFSMEFTAAQLKDWAERLMMKLKG